MTYENPIPVVDGIIEKNKKILLVKRASNPFMGKLALPGGHVDYGETVENAVAREIREETGIEAEVNEILGVYSERKRDPRKHRISTVFVMNMLDEGNAGASSDAQSIGFYDMNELEEDDLSFDHYKIIQDYIQWKENKGTFWSSKQI